MVARGANPLGSIVVKAPSEKTTTSHRLRVGTSISAPSGVISTFATDHVIQYIPTKEDLEEIKEKMKGILTSVG